ncbi:MAG: PH domain-containing protein [bacterium]
MIIQNQEHHLGIRSFFVSSYKNTFVAVMIFIIAIFLSAASSFFISYGNTLVNKYQQSNGGNAIDISPFVFMGLSIIFVLSFVAFVIGVFVSWLNYMDFTFTFKEFEIRVKRGILNIEEISIPYHQASNIRIDRDIMYRLFGVSRLVISTAGHEDPGEEEEATFDPIDKDLAEEMQAMLQSRTGIQIVQERK